MWLRILGFVARRELGLPPMRGSAWCGNDFYDETDDDMPDLESSTE